MNSRKGRAAAGAAKRVLVTGAAGLLGGHVLDRASMHPALAIIPVIHQTVLPNAIKADLLDEDSIRRAVEETRPDIIIHLAALQPAQAEKDPASAEALHVRAPLRLANAAPHARFIHLSTDMVYSGGKGAPYTASDDPAPVSLYGKTKLEGERALLSACGNAVILRSALIIGRPLRRPGGFLHWMTGEALAGRSLPLFHDQLRTPIAAPDLAEMILRLAENNVRGVFLAGGERGVNRVEMGEWLLASMGRPLSLIRRVKTPPSLQRDLRLDSSRIRKKVPFSFTDIKDYIERAGKDWRKNGQENI